MIRSIDYKGKNLDDILEQISIDEAISKNDILYQVKEESGLFSKSLLVKYYSDANIIEFLEQTIMELLRLMGLNEVSIDTAQREQTVVINLNTDNNAVIIGKEGRNMESLQYYLKTILHNQANINFNFILDIEGYKQKKQKRLIRFAHELADEAIQTGETVYLKNINSYERRLVHQALSKSDLIETHSEGEGQNRYLVITPKEK